MSKENGLKFKYRGRWLDSVTNPKGHLAPVIICQTEHPGFTVRYAKKPWRIISYGHRNAEKLAVRLVKKGHRKVTFWD